MGFKLGFALGFGAGFLTGSRAGRDPYDKVSEKVKEFRQSDEIERLAEEAKTRAADLKERAVEKVKASGNGESGSRSPLQDKATGGPMAGTASKTP